jgi:hypothetical protein
MVLLVPMSTTIKFFFSFHKLFVFFESSANSRVLFPSYYQKGVFLHCFRSDSACKFNEKGGGKSYLERNLFVYSRLYEQFLNYPAAIDISGDRAANLNLCLALMAF